MEKQENIIYLAINKETGKIMSGAKGQAAFFDQNTLARSVGQNYRYTAQTKGVKVKDLYSVLMVNINTPYPINQAQEEASHD